ncbi:MAG: signal peptidase I [Myxococcota bacterium]|nr:signal peptidase I [Myxococcota bacterium]
MTPMLKRILKILAVLVALLLVAVAIPMRTVGNDEMAWTLQSGDKIWVLPVSPLKGDVVLLDDPLDPDRTVLRRIVAVAEDKITYEDGTMKLNGKRVRQTDMGKGDIGGRERRVFKEVIWSRPPARPTNWLITRLVDKPVSWKLDEKVEIPAGHVYLLADERDGAMDSRWWGPVPLEAIQGVVRARLGVADEWREAAQYLKPIE